jgi:YidC/Oxa1 family membrane protein insertase
MEKRALIAVVISIAILVLYQEVVLRYIYPPPAQEEQVSEGSPAATAAVSEERNVAEPNIPPAPRPEARAAAVARKVTIETDLYKATFTSVGARLESFALKKYRTTVDPDSPPQEMIVRGTNGELPFGVELRGQQALSDNDAAYAVEGSDRTLSGTEEASLAFSWDSGAATIVKRFTCRADRYEFAVLVGARNVPHEYNEIAVSWPKGTDVRPQLESETILDHAVYLQSRKLIENPFDKLAAGEVVAGDISWSGYAGRHFFAAMVPSESEGHRLWLKLRDHTVEEKFLFPISAEASQQALQVYIGPKDFDALEGLGHSLSRAVNLGWFSFIAVPLLHVLNLSHRFTDNYGVDIVLLTVLIKILFIPLTQRSFRSMREMQKLQPQMAKIRERFKDKSEQMNKEIMELYRRHKVNPLGGCLPMLLQMPVFIGLYQALLNTVELRHAPFMLWINDLSAPDRLGSLQLPFVQHPGIPVLTLLMGVSMFVQQWMTPSAGDPQQQRAMMIMPLVFTFMFVNFPSGLALYWLVNNLLTIAQQYYINRTAT